LKKELFNTIFDKLHTFYSYSEDNIKKTLRFSHRLNLCISVNTKSQIFSNKIRQLHLIRSISAIKSEGNPAVMKFYMTHVIFINALLKRSYKFS